MTHGVAGIHPLSEHFTISAFASLVERHASSGARSFLLDHDVMTPIDEEHVDRILALAQLDPDTAVGVLSEPELHRFHRSIRDVLGHLLEGYHGYGS
jgi:formamidopyrimidine-DNA glycosylase